MHDLIETIRAAVAEGATMEAKQAGAEACRTILAALDTESTRPQAGAAAPAPATAPSAAPAPSAAATPANPFAPLAGLDLDRALDLVIARLRAAVPEEKRPAKPSIPGVRIQLVPVPKGR